MGIESEIVNVEIEFEEAYGDSSVLEVLGDEKNNQKIVKIEISTAIFIHRKYIKDADYVTVDVIPFHHVKSCVAALKGEPKRVPFNRNLRGSSL